WEQFRTAQRARQQQAKEIALDECCDDGLGQLAPAFDLGCGGGELGCEFARPPQEVDVLHVGVKAIGGARRHSLFSFSSPIRTPQTSAPSVKPASRRVRREPSGAPSSRRL